MASTWSRTDLVPRARKWLAGGLIRLAHRIYPPKVTEIHMNFQRGEHVITAHDAAAHLRAWQARSQVYPGLR